MGDTQTSCREDYKELKEFGDPQRLGYVCKVFRAYSNESLFASFGEGVGAKYIMSGIYKDF